MLSFVVGEAVASFEKQPAGAKQRRFPSRRPIPMGAALQIPSELDKGLTEPADDVEPVQDMLRLRQVLLDSRPVGCGIRQ